jgi:K+-sensing histidine kinase KdpD
VVVRVRERGTQHIVIEVVDHGLGIPPEQVGKLFQKFARVRTDDHLKVSGTGLGLYISRLIVEGHGGQIWVESELGKGSTFGLALPVDARAAQRAPAGGEQAGAPAAPAGSPAASPDSPAAASLKDTVRLRPPPEHEP